MKHLSRHDEISDPQTGLLVLAAMVVMHAIEDVRLYLVNPVSVDSDAVEAKHHTNERATQARQAAQWLQGAECAEYCELLAACGYPVPLRRMFRELKALKAKEVAA